MTTRTRILLLLAAAGIAAFVGWHLVRTANEAVTLFGEMDSDRPGAGKPASLDAARPPAKPDAAPIADPAGDDLVPLGDVPAGGFGVIARVTVGVDGGETEPVPGVVVRMWMRTAESLTISPRTATTDAAGEARFPPIPVPRVPRRLAESARILMELEGEGTWRTIALPKAPGVRRTTLEDVAAVERDPSTSDRVLWLRVEYQNSSGPLVSVRVTTAEGLPLEHAMVYEKSRGWGPSTDAAGGYRFHVAHPGRTTLQVAPMLWGDVRSMLDTEVDVTAGGLAGLHLVVPGLGSIEGVALDRDGIPAAGAEICLTRAGETVGTGVMYLYASSGSPNAVYHLRTHAGADGRFRFAGTLDGKSYDVRWWATQREDRVAAAAVPSGARGVEVRMDRHGVLPRLVDARDGRPVYGVVSYRPGGGEDMERRGMDAPDQDGFVAEPGMRVSVHARARGFADVFLEHVVGTMTGLEPLEIRMRPTDAERAQVWVRAVDPAGATLPWPAVRWTHEATGVVVEVEGRKVDGAFVTDELDAGLYRVRTEDSYGVVDAPEYVGLPGSGALRFALASELHVDVPASGAVKLDWTLPRGGAMRLTFQDASGRPVEPGDMRAVWAKDATGTTLGVHLFRPGRDGRFEAGTGEVATYESQAFRAGEYEVTWYRYGGSDAPPPDDARSATARVRLVAGEVTAVELRAGVKR